jgi:hypothetical protein
MLGLQLCELTFETLTFGLGLGQLRATGFQLGENLDIQKFPSFPLLFIQSSLSPLSFLVSKDSFSLLLHFFANVII